MMNHHQLVERLEVLALTATHPTLRSDLAVLTLELRNNHTPHMGERHYDLATRKWVDAPLPCGVQTAISWTRLIDELRRSGEFRTDERVAQLEIGANGISFHLETD